MNTQPTQPAMIDQITEHLPKAIVSVRNRITIANDIHLEGLLEEFDAKAQPGFMIAMYADDIIKNLIIEGCAPDVQFAKNLPEHCVKLVKRMILEEAAVRWRRGLRGKEEAPPHVQI